MLAFDSFSQKIMKFATLSELANFYQKRFAFQNPVIQSSVRQETKMILVIPCHQEPDLMATLQSLAKADGPRFPVEILMVVNASEASEEGIHQQNQKSLQEAKAWVVSEAPTHLKLHLIDTPNLPRKHAGVGLARKIGMDEALSRFAQIDYNGLIVCLDADCQVAPSYLQGMEKAFLAKNFKSASIYFEHIFPEEITLKAGIIHYELFLRYYVEALRYANYPYAFHTVGSSMAVRADVYALSGGMNRRKAGEDFYFMHKVAPLGDHINLNTTTVYPSARVSERVPFGTGRAQHQWQQHQQLLTYHPEIFEVVKDFLAKTDEWYQSFDSLARLSSEVFAFLEENDFQKKILEIRKKSTSLEVFRQHYFAWLDGLKILKLVHHLRDEIYGELLIEEAATELWAKIANRNHLTSDTDTEKLLYLYREKERLD